MNYFGLFFTFMLPGLVLGAMASSVLRSEMDRRRNKTAEKNKKTSEAPRGKLYIHNLTSDLNEHAA